MEMYNSLDGMHCLQVERPGADPEVSLLLKPALQGGIAGSGFPGGYKLPECGRIGNEAGRSGLVEVPLKDGQARAGDEVHPFHLKVARLGGGEGKLLVSIGKYPQCQIVPGGRTLRIIREPGPARSDPLGIQIGPVGVGLDDKRILAYDPQATEVLHEGLEGRHRPRVEDGTLLLRPVKSLDHAHHDVPNAEGAAVVPLHRVEEIRRIVNQHPDVGGKSFGVEPLLLGGLGQSDEPLCRGIPVNPRVGRDLHSLRDKLQV